MATALQKQAFLEQITPLANKYGGLSGLDPDLIISQAALESAWGTKAPNNNYFGIKGPGGLQTTQEFVGGKMVTVQDSFVGYSSLEDSVKGYTGFVGSNPRYADVFGKTGDSAVEAMAATGYATDPDYGGKLKNVIKSIKTKDVVNGAKAAAQVASGDFVGAAMTVLGVGNGEGGSLVDGIPIVKDVFGSDNVFKKFFEWLKELFSANTAARTAAILIGLLLIAGAIWALLNSDTIINNISKGVENVA